jgi:erythrocyte band 7 integral membrane protein
MCRRRRREQSAVYSSPHLQILSKDSVTVSVEAAVYYRVSNAVRSVVNAENAQHSTRLLAQTTLRNTLGMRSLSAILSERDSIAHTMQGILDEATEVWGIKVERVEM